MSDNPNAGSVVIDGKTGSDMFLEMLMSSVGNVQPGDAAKAVEKHVDDKPAEKLYAGKFKTVEEMEHGYSEAQSRMSRAINDAKALEADAERARRLSSILDVVESDPGFRQLATQYLAGNTAPQGRAPAAVQVQQEVDENGEPTGRLLVDQDEIRRIARAESEAIASSKVKEVQKEQAMRTQFEQLRADHPNMSNDELAEFISWVKKPENLTLDKLFVAYNKDAIMAEAANKGRKEVMSRVQETSRMAPSIGATPGIGERELSLADMMRMDIENAAKKANPIKNALGL